MKPFVIGTRGSALALAQAELTEEALRTALPDLEFERKVIKTSGDLRPDLPLADFSKGDNPVVDKGIFTKELEVALAAGEIDCAVHSTKDVPTDLPEGFALPAFLPRAPVEDVLLVSRDSCNYLSGFDALPAGAVVGTSSVRRIRQIKHLWPQLVTKEIRGNVPTRIRKLNDPKEGIDAILLARAGLERLGEEPASGYVLLDGSEATVCILDAVAFLPACGQGAVGYEIREDNTRAREILEAINDEECRIRTEAERHFLHLLQAGCQTPVGAFTSIREGLLFMNVSVFDEESPTAPPRIANGNAAVADSLKLAASLFDEVTR